MATIGSKFVERVAQFGPEKGLVGVVAEPAELSNQIKPAVVILNTGTVHRVGHHRMYVSMARKLARAGHTVLRFDFSGLGDSLSQLSDQPLLQSNFADIGHALKWLQTTRGVSRAVLIGLCSGADHAILYGFSDTRIVGLVLIDPYVPPTTRYFIDYFSRRLRDVRNWRHVRLHKSKLLRRFFEHLSQTLRREGGPQHLVYQGMNVRASLERAYEATAQAGVKMLVICTGRHHAPRQTYREQFVSAFSRVSFETSLRLEFFKDADHTFSSVKSRTELDESVTRWCETTSFERSPFQLSTTEEIAALWSA
ncbi:alpha/beta fold hydrolase [Bradyrhizobium sp. CIAT3101]|uniref:alpha/beta fold hydrolase n=1 Tax=Bradyrhizobium sp. CIAT3101 TaxID=439387 RepID=UPI0024B193E1|nr:alpha/beta fold hydrolase [Bradyrhizobium sp. CIAT3101]WFU79157.1 alpha/beta fold hydrolase [Bradyrhizobium sp. CIAT3101]